MSYGDWVWPAPGNHTITQEFGVPVGSGTHGGIDIGTDLDDDIVSVASGEVVFAGEDGAWGNAVRIRHADDIVTLYAHNHTINVDVGDKVHRAQVIAASDSTGNSTGDHLHFGVYPGGGSPVDPWPYISDAEEGSYDGSDGGGGGGGGFGDIGDVLGSINWTSVLLVIGGVFAVLIGIVALTADVSLRGAGAAVGSSIGDALKSSE
jgi:hypothetical protein